MSNTTRNLVLAAAALLTIGTMTLSSNDASARGFYRWHWHSHHWGYRHNGHRWGYSSYRVARACPPGTHLGYRGRYCHPNRL